MRGARMDLGDGDHELRQGICAAAHDALQRLHDATACQQRVDGCVWHRRVPSHTINVDRELIRPGHYGAGIDVKSAQLMPWRIVHPVDPRNVKALHHTFLDHDLAAAATFFIRLKDQCGPAREIARLGQILGGP